MKQEMKLIYDEITERVEDLKQQMEWSDCAMDLDGFYMDMEDSLEEMKVILENS